MGILKLTMKYLLDAQANFFKFSVNTLFFRQGRIKHSPGHEMIGQSRVNRCSREIPISDLRKLVLEHTRQETPYLDGKVGLTQNSLTVFCIRHRRLLAGGRTWFSVSPDSPLWYSDTRQSVRSSSRRRIRSNGRKVSDLGDLDEISSSYAGRINDTRSRGSFGTSTCRRWSSEIHRK